jgi:hypothetical protein
MITTDKTFYTTEKTKLICKNSSCNHPAMCNEFICYKKKQGKYDCDTCEECLCKRHWRIYFKNNI